MKPFLTFLILFSFSFKTRSQSKDTTNYLLLGLLNDYNGRLLYRSIDNQVEHFYPYEKPLIEFLDSVLSKEGRQYRIVSKDGHFYLNSKSIAKFLNSFYTFKTDSGYILPNPQKNKWELRYIGRINERQTTNLLLLKKFIIGNYIRRGERNGYFYIFRFVNSVSTSSYFLKLITKMGCSNITSSNVMSIPGETVIQFKPTSELIGCMQKYEYLRTKIIQSRSSLIQKR